MNPNSDNKNRPEALLNARPSERRYGELGLIIVKNKYIGVMKIIIISLLLLLNFNCERHSFKMDDELSLKRTDYEGNQLRIDGYYYLLIDTVVGTTMFFYENGVLKETGGIESINKKKQFELLLLDVSFNNKVNNMKDSWGVFSIDAKDIKFERWYPGQGAKKAYVREGTILNDTTFRIIKSYRSDGSEVSDKDELYHFRQFSPKPDSTNVFIK
jgi:hypothetical protein